MSIYIDKQLLTCNDKYSPIYVNMCMYLLYHIVPEKLNDKSKYNQLQVSMLDAYM